MLVLTKNFLSLNKILKFNLDVYKYILYPGVAYTLIKYFPKFSLL